MGTLPVHRVGKIFAIGVGAAILGGLLSGLRPALAEILTDAGSLPGAVVPEDREQMHLTFAPLVKKAAPAVVNIYTSRVVEERRRLSPFFDDPFFRQFFGDAFRFRGPVQKRIENALGSGVVVSPDGLVVTSYHVIKGSDEIKVVLADRREFKAQIVSADERTDLAVLRIDPGGEDFSHLPFGDSDSLEVGDLVLAIGNPFGVGQTVTSGIVSALARTSVGVTDYNFFIQTDAAINPGNSGGALIDMEGSLVGINTAIFSKSGGSHGIGFAIPVNMVKAVVRSAEAGVGVVRPWLGASGQAVTADIADSLDLPRPQGVLINVVRKGGPADEAGLRIGDVVIAVDGKEVKDIGAMRFRLATLPVGGKARLLIIRDGAAETLEVDLIAPPEDPPRDISTLHGAHPLEGATVANLSPAFNLELNLDDLLKGVFLLELRRGSTAHRLDFNPGDIILTVNGAEVESVAHLKSLFARGEGRWRISVKRGDRVLTEEFNR